MVQQNLHPPPPPPAPESKDEASWSPKGTIFPSLATQGRKNNMKPTVDSLAQAHARLRLINRPM